MNNPNGQFDSNFEYSAQTENNSDFTTFQANNFDEEKRVQEIKNLNQSCMILGIVSAAISFVCPCLFVAAIILGCLSLSKYVKAKKLMGAQKADGQLIAGLVCSIVSLAVSGLTALGILLYIALFGFVAIIGFIGAL